MEVHGCDLFCVMGDGRPRRVLSKQMDVMDDGLGFASILLQLYE